MSFAMYSVSSLVHYIKESIDQDFNLRSILLKGEVSNFTNHRSGHWYFTLKDSKAKISCVMFSSYAGRSKILLKEGMKIIVSGSVSMYEAGGSIQMYVTSVQVDGLGDLYLQLEAVKEKLSKEGLFDPNHKKKLPLYPKSIGIITAKTGAAIQDILSTIARRWPIADVAVYPTLVQGVQAKDAIVKQLIYADDKGHDVIILARGGGAIEDLWCFNEEVVARTIYDMHTVLVSGVGHETDTTLVDYVSDARAPTPTAAAELITPDIYEVKQVLAMRKAALVSLMDTRISAQKKRLQIAKEYRYLKDPLSYIAQKQMKLAMHVKELGVVSTQAKQLHQDLHRVTQQLAISSQRMQQYKALYLKDLSKKLQYEMANIKTLSRQQFLNKTVLLDAFSPLKILARGYHIAYHGDHIVKHVSEVEKNDDLKLRMQDGYIHVNVKNKEVF